MLCNTMFSQKSALIISTESRISKYHEKVELELMTKGDLIKLNTERLKVLISVLTYLPITNKQGVSLNDLAIPISNKDLLKHKESIIIFNNSNLEIQNNLLPFAEKINLIASVLYYEEILKLYHNVYD